MKKNTSISLISHFERFTNTEEKKERELIKALEIGEQSSFIENFYPKQHLEFLHQSTKKI